MFFAFLTNFGNPSSSSLEFGGSAGDIIPRYLDPELALVAEDAAHL